MPVQLLAPPTISEIALELAEFERQYHISTNAFIEAEGRIPEVDEDDAVEWLYCWAQFLALQGSQVGCAYSHAERGAKLKNCERVMDLLAA